MVGIGGERKETEVPRGVRVDRPGSHAISDSVKSSRRPNVLGFLGSGSAPSPEDREGLDSEL